MSSWLSKIWPRTKCNGCLLAWLLKQVKLEESAMPHLPAKKYICSSFQATVEEVNSKKNVNTLIKTPQKSCMFKERRRAANGPPCVTSSNLCCWIWPLCNLYGELVGGRLEHFSCECSTITLARCAVNCSSGQSSGGKKRADVSDKCLILLKQTWLVLSQCLWGK